MVTRPLPGPEELYDAAPCGLLLAEATGEILHVNATLCQWLKHRREALVGKVRFQDLLTMGGRIFHQTHIAPLLRMQGSVAEVKLEFLASDGRTIPVMVNLAERGWQGRTVLHVAAFVAEDRHKYERELIAQRKRAEELSSQQVQTQRDLAEARAQAEDRALFAEQMVGIVSHDLRNPLSAIHMSSALLGMGAVPEQQRAVLGRINRSVGRAERLITDLLDFTQARLGGGLAVERKSVDLHEVIAESVSELAVAFPERSIVHVREGAGACSADADRVTQALGNLVGNAVTYGSPYQPVTVTTRTTGQSFDILVHNDGEPIPAAMKEALFEPMVRGAKAAGARGVGLGLYIVREIAKAHGGTVSVESAAGVGTTFKVSLPNVQTA
jgi:sigma-B regulation protein RsbU (phosphoserine phosphatase)